jgi:hypothetical protein
MIVQRRDTALPVSSAIVLTPPRPHGLTIVELCAATTRFISWFRWLLQPFCPEPPILASYPSELDITIALVPLQLVSSHPATNPSLPAVLFLAEQVVSSSSSTTSRGSSEVGRRRDSSHAGTHDSVLGRVRVAPLDAGVDVSLYRRRNLSAISYSCAHSSPASSWMAMR